jgi:hypothetical protein
MTAGVIVCYGPQMEERSRTSMGVRWCFKCRTRAEFSWVVMSPVIDWDDEGSIYAAMWGPTAYSECGHCGKHGGELFPGWVYQWEVDDDA